ncbi:MAG TPA: TetR family transcriptional regulator [Friedmanniella sp.]
MPRDSTPTKGRILDAATDEFAAHGLAGARVARISQASGANPSSIYAHFVSKERLFDAAVTRALASSGAEVPITPDDLPGFAERSFDWLLAHPKMIRLHMWRILEAPEAGPDDRDVYARLVQQMAAQSQAPEALPPQDLLIMITGMIINWVVSSRDLLTADGRGPEDPARIAQYRVSLREAVNKLQGP